MPVAGAHHAATNTLAGAVASGVRAPCESGGIHRNELQKHLLECNCGMTGQCASCSAPPYLMTQVSMMFTRFGWGVCAGGAALYRDMTVCGWCGPPTSEAVCHGVDMHLPHSWQREATPAARSAVRQTCDIGEGHDSAALLPQVRLLASWCATL